MPVGPYPPVGRVPLELGLSVGHPNGSPGSIGPFVRLHDGRSGFLSSGVVLAPPGAQRGDMIHHPAPREQAVLTGESRIAELREFTSLVQGGLARFHYGAAALLPGIVSFQNQLPSTCPDAGLRIISADDTLPIQPGDEVAFIGSGSGFSTGTIDAVDLCGLQIAWRTSFVQFDGGFEVTGSDDAPFSRPGDGGALVYRRSDGAALGMILASTRGTKGADKRPPCSYVMPLAPILADLGATLAVLPDMAKFVRSSPK